MIKLRLKLRLTGLRLKGEEIEKRVSQIDTSLEGETRGTAGLYQLYSYVLDKGDAERNKQQPGEKRERGPSLRVFSLLPSPSPFSRSPPRNLLYSHYGSSFDEILNDVSF